jgi:restriction system protein
VAIRYEVEVRHAGLGKYRHITGSDRYVVQQKALAQEAQWEAQWTQAQEKAKAAAEKVKAAEAKNMSKENAKRYKEERKQEAEDRATAANDALQGLMNTLAHTLSINDAIDWDALKDKKPYGKAKPIFSPPQAPDPAPDPQPPIPLSLPPKPDESDAKYRPEFGLMDKLLQSRKKQKIEEAGALYATDLWNWENDCKELKNQFANRVKQWQERKADLAEQNSKLQAQWASEVKEGAVAHEHLVADWTIRRDRYLAKQQETNVAIETSKAEYLACAPGAVSDYCEMVLANSEYPDFFPKEWDLEYVADTRTLVLEYALPAPDALPTLKDVQYVQTKDDFKESYLSDKERDSLYDSLLYQVTLRTLHELFEADVANALDAIVFNGLVTTIDRAVGKEVTACIVSVHAGKDEFMAINLANVDPKACFKSLKGVAAAKLTGLAPVAPILMIDKADRRFVDSYAVADGLTAGDNLASMDWEDFEHLIRELFEKEFANGGSEVKVTRASRDGGVDAVLFDPDPIRGGKIVIQAKRYANTVGVSAVRDLYGTMINEGAMKGILVSTANYGPDAHEFAKGKPLTLMNGSNLLHLLQKHGHQARIDLVEAKIVNNAGKH